MNFESCNFREIKKITCGSSRGLSQMVKVDECQGTIATQLGISHLSKSGLSETELILSRAGHSDLTKDQVEQVVICPQHRHKLGKFNYVILYPDECFFSLRRQIEKEKKFDDNDNDDDDDDHEVL